MSTTETGAPTGIKGLSLFALLKSLPQLLIALAKDEIASFRKELVGKLKHAAVGIGLLAGAAFLGFFLLIALLTAAVLGFATVVPGWLAALIVAGILLILITVLVLLGIRQLKSGVPPAPTETIKSVKKDVNAIKGITKGGNE
jgi:predicted phage tail protein